MLCHNPQSININKTIQHRCDLNIHLESANCAKRWHKDSRSNKPAMKLLWKNTEGAMPLSIIKIAHLQSYSEFFIMQTFHNPYQQLFPQVAVKVSLKKKKKDFMAWFLQNYKKRYFHSGPVVKNLPSNEGYMDSIPGQKIKILPATGQLSPFATTMEALCYEACMQQWKILPAAIKSQGSKR